MYRNTLTKSVSVSELRQMRDSGMTNRDIAKQLDIAPSTVGRYLGPADMQSRSKHKKQCRREITPGMVADIQRLFGEGRSINSIAERFGVGWMTVKKIIAGTKQEQKDVPEEPVTPVEPEPVAAAEPVADAEPVAAEPVSDDEPEEQEGENSMFQMISRRQTIRLKGFECEYELELGGGTDTVTVISGGTEVAMFDKKMLQAFIEELKQLDRQYLAG